LAHASPEAGRLCRLLTLGNRRAVKGECHFSFQDMLEASDGQVLIAIPPFSPSEQFAQRLAVLAKAARRLSASMEPEC